MLKVSLLSFNDLQFNLSSFTNNDAKHDLMVDIYLYGMKKNDKQKFRYILSVPIEIFIQ